ncbi:stage V sporulation protein AE [Bacillus sp. Marseille-P3661]|uniref:stage V sporulation protein AE n=1 Tax=Bacillus sp. Marseille-P3661 TaxID=1936234 RepID=UPI000C851AE2|nr:stage V sporulation protein AE [Bacillus sp. Marseille-P3661]
MKRKVILVTDGDEYAHHAVLNAAKKVGGHCISQSAGNPTTMSGSEMVRLAKKTIDEPVFLMFDDSGLTGEGSGERALKYVATHPDIEVLGVIAVASKTRYAEWTRVDVSIDRDGNLTEFGVDKSGLPDIEIGRINGDTVYVLDQLNIPIVIGVGDIGKMSRYDSLEKGCPITLQAVELILERSGFNDNSSE